MTQEAQRGAEPHPGGRVIKVAVVEDQREMREALAELISTTPGFQCCGVFRTAESAIEGFAQCVSELALVDLGLPGLSGIEAIRILKELHPRLFLLVLTVFDDETRIFEALCAGAAGYLLKSTPPVRILQSIRETADGGAVMSPHVARKVVRLFQTYAPSRQVDFQLTVQESRVLALLVEGNSYREAAEELRISPNTLSTHVKRIYDKLQVHSKSQAVAKAIRGRMV